MNETSLGFLQRCMNTASPSGFEVPLAQVWKEEADGFADRTWSDVKGNAYAVLNESGSPRVMLAGHADEIGLMITRIDDDGYLQFSTIGGFDPQVLPGQRVRIQTKHGEVLGAIGRTAVHLLEKDDKEKVVRLRELWIDIAATSKEDAESMVQIGDPAVLDYSYAKMTNGMVIARGFDDRVGAFVVLEALRLLGAMKPSCAVYAVATAQEEVGFGGARASSYGIDPQVAIAVDVEHATDTPGIGDGKRRVGDVRLGRGPAIGRGPHINHRVFELLTETADRHQIQYQPVGISGETGTDCDAIHDMRAGVATGVVSIPNRYMHSPCEIIHLEDVENTARLIAETVAGIDEKTDFVPS
jgi:putative aminopeptidase FrvX